ncbi:hypothetical protein M1M16_gp39 [Methanobacterium virus Drs3]|uniref:Uncharacterized protein n=1 Tax=Methanobacterium virus Drs3 TaxID=1430441 RepID=A0A385AGY0_9CAUD|nr:hypothetical protein M1M16_gp39 [Methanobacterium virus Drs3]AXN53420.1 hypothetical protein Drs3_00039 [Methanobacterium virus Drs3]
MKEIEEMKRKAYALFRQANIVFADETEVEIQIKDTELNENDYDKISEISETCIRNFYNFEFKVDSNQHLVFIIIDADYFDLD